MAPLQSFCKFKRLLFNEWLTFYKIDSEENVLLFCYVLWTFIIGVENRIADVHWYSWRIGVLNLAHFYLQSRSSCMYATKELDTTEDYLRVILFHPLSFSSVFFHHGNTNNLDIYTENETQKDILTG